MIHHKFHLIPGGYLELIRRCTAQTCLGHCVCSPNAKRCHLIENACTDVSAGRLLWPIYIYIYKIQRFFFIKTDNKMLINNSIPVTILKINGHIEKLADTTIVNLLTIIPS